MQFCYSRPFFCLTMRGELVNHPPFDLVVPGSNPGSSWMFVFDLVLSRCYRFIICTNYIRTLPF